MIKVNAHKNIDWGSDLISQAYHQLQSYLGDSIQWIGQSQTKRWENSRDAVFRLNGRQVHVVAKEVVGAHNLDQLASDQQKIGMVLLIANYITPPAAEKLKALGVNYMDGKGNMWVRMEQVLICIEGIPNEPPRPNLRTRLFAKAGLHVLFWLLQNRDDVNLSYRELADRAGVALGNLPTIFKALQEEGFIVRVRPKEWRLLRWEDMLTGWVQEFGRRLKPAIFIGRFRPAVSDFRQHWRELPLHQGAIWSGEPSAGLLANALQPAAFTMYTNASRAEIIKSYRWVPDPNGEIAVYRKFWKDDQELDGLAAPLLTYVDLLEEGDERGIEAAQIIRNQYLIHD